jgi:hypothetical protein
MDINDLNVQISNEIIDEIDLNLPPGLLTKTAQRSGLLSLERLAIFDEVSLLKAINTRLAPKFREMIVQ